jgi:hypothetical protein
MTRAQLAEHQRRPIVCGTLRSYVQGKCRCPKCRKARSEYIKTWRAAKRRNRKVPHEHRWRVHAYLADRKYPDPTMVCGICSTFRQASLIKMAAIEHRAAQGASGGVAA